MCVAVGLLPSCEGVPTTLPGDDLAAPEVELTSPLAGAIISQPQEVLLEATASDNVGVERVEFYDGTVLKGTVYEAPYRFNWNVSYVDNGTHTLTAQAFDAAGNSAVSLPVEITIDVGDADTMGPQVSITAPGAGVEYSMAQTVTIAAEASDNVGVAKVEFYVDDVLLGEDVTSPFEQDWVVGSALNGSHELTAKAYDAADNVTTSGIVEVIVAIDGADTTAPQVSLTAPTDGAMLTAGGPVDVTAMATDDVGVTRVSFFLDGTRLLGTDTTAPFSVPWNVVFADNGTHVLSATAYDAAANSTKSAEITVTVGIADSVKPTVSLTSPAASTKYTTAQTVSITATAADNVKVTKVEFYVDGMLLSSDATSPYRASWPITAAKNGTHSLTAKAFDAAGNSTVSAARSVTVEIAVADTTPPVVTLTAPKAATVFTTAQTVTLTATASDNAGVTRVEFFDGTELLGSDTTAPYSLPWAVVFADNGTHALSAVAYDGANSTTSAVITVTVNIPDTIKPTVSLTSPAANATYTTAQSVAIAATAADNVKVTKVEFYVDGVLLSSDTASPYTATWPVTSAKNGTHSITAKAFDAAGNNTVSAARSVTVGIFGTAILTWKAPTTNTDGSALTDLAGYKVYTRVTGAAFGTGISVGVSTSPTYTYRNLALGKTHYFTVTAYDFSGNESTQAPEVSKVIP